MADTDRTREDDENLAVLARLADDLRATTAALQGARNRCILELKAAGYNHRELAEAAQVRSARIFQILNEARPEEDLDGNGSTRST